MKRQHKLNSQEQAEEQLQAAAQQQAQSVPQEFASVEEMLRHDALHTPVPPNVATRLQKSIGPAAASPAWWRRFFGGPRP